MKELLDLLSKELSAESIFHFITHLSQFHRIQGSTEFLRAAQYLKSVLTSSGLASRIHSFPCDGAWEAYGWTAPISWNIVSGECWLLKPRKKRLARFRDIPMSIITHSKAVDFEASVVDVKKGEKLEDYEEATGKVALLTGSPRRVFPYAAQHGVKGLLLYPDAERAANIGDATVQYDGFWPDASNLSEVTAGFSLSAKQARELQGYLANSEEVRVHFKIDAQFNTQTGELHVLEAEIPGSSHATEEIVLIGHLCHPAPGANDNLSGCATLVDLARSMMTLIVQGQLPPLKRTIRFLWVPEFSGTIPWLKMFQLAENRKILAVLNLDMVGESPSKIGTPLTVSSPSISTPSYLRALVNRVCELVAGLPPDTNTSGRFYHLNYRMAPFSGGSDHYIFNDQFFGIPGVMLGHPDPYHHSHADDLDKVDPLECRSAGLIVGCVAFGLATAPKIFLEDLLRAVVTDGLKKILAFETDLRQRSDFTGQQKIRQSQLLEEFIVSQINSLITLDPDNSLASDTQFFSQMITSIFSRIRGKLILEHTTTNPSKIPSNTTVISRAYNAPTSYKSFRNPNRQENKNAKLELLMKGSYGGVPLELLNLANGRRSVEDIFLLTNLQYPGISAEDIDFLVSIFLDEGLLSEKS